MPPIHCPHCNSKRSAAIGAANYYDNTLVEHHCSNCGRLFCISDRRTGAPQTENFSRANTARAAVLQSGKRKFLN